MYIKQSVSFQSVCFAAMSNCCSDPNYTTQDTGNNDNEEKAQSVNIALEWVNEPLNSLLKGLLPANQIHVDKLLRYRSLNTTSLQFFSVKLFGLHINIL